MGEGGGDDGPAAAGHKPHRSAQKGRKADKKDSKSKKFQDNVDPRIRNPKAFAINSAVRAERKFRRGQDMETKKDRVPLVDRSPVEPPPFIIAIVGPPKVGKSTLFMNLVKNYTRQTLSDIKGPVTIVSGKKRRLTIVECNNDINSMIDVAKVADLALLLVDASFGFEMEVFEFLNICQVSDRRLKL
jgi:ribosome biogenesis protein BMS1